MIVVMRRAVKTPRRALRPGGTLAQARPRFGYLRIWVLLRREGWGVNRKRVRRLYRLDGLQVRMRVRRRRSRGPQGGQYEDSATPAEITPVPFPCGPTPVPPSPAITVRTQGRPVLDDLEPLVADPEAIVLHRGRRRLRLGLALLHLLGRDSRIQGTKWARS
jgi:hypothetical protein